MTSFIAKRVVMAILVAAFVSLVSFMLLRVSGDLAQSMAGPLATPEQVDGIRKAYGLDRPMFVQYLDWMAGILRGDLGTSFYFREPVLGLIAERFPTTVLLGAMSLLLAVLYAVPLGVAGAVFRGSTLDRVGLFSSALGQSAPGFLVALLLILLFGITLRWLPISGSSTWQNFIMPTVALAFYAHPPLLRLTRSGMIDVLQSDYLRTARANGLSPFSIVFKHALRNALIPVVAVAAVQLGHLLGGSVVVETIFAIHGVGYLAWESISRGDFPIIQSILLMMSGIYVLLTLLADLLNARLDPRLRIQS